MVIIIMMVLMITMMVYYDDHDHDMQRYKEKRCMKMNCFGLGILVKNHACNWQRLTTIYTDMTSTLEINERGSFWRLAFRSKGEENLILRKFSPQRCFVVT